MARPAWRETRNSRFERDDNLFSFPRFRAARGIPERAIGRGAGAGSAAMLQGALTAVAAKAKEAKAAVGSAVGEIRDAIDNPTYDEHEDDAWSDEEADARVPASTDVPPRADGGGASVSGGPAAAPAGGALAALRARLAAERERKKAEEHIITTGSANPPAEAPPPPPPPSVPEPAHQEETHSRETHPTARVPEPAFSPDADPVETVRSADGKSSIFDDDAAARLRDAERAVAELASARREDAAKHAEALRIATQNAELATRDLQAQKFETEKKEKELERLRRHLLDMEAEDDEKEERLSAREAEAARRAEGTIAAATEASVSAARAAERDAEILREALAAKDKELANLQLALEHFDDEAEDAERRALEASALREKNATLAAELVAERARVAAAQEKARDAETRAAAMEKHAAAADAAAQKSVLEASRARRALQEHAKRAVSLSADSSEQVDRRVVAKLLLTYFQREQSVDVLELMARVLGMSEEDKKEMGLGPGGARQKKGVLGTVASVPGRVVFGALGLAGTVAKVPVAVAEVYTPETETATVADQWVEFLLQQMDAEDEEG